MRLDLASLLAALASAAGAVLDPREAPMGQVAGEWLAVQVTGVEIAFPACIRYVPAVPSLPAATAEGKPRALGRLLTARPVGSALKAAAGPATELRMRVEPAEATR
jgi:hypothetical protein